MFVLDKKYAKKIQNKQTANERVEAIKMDEHYKFVERKNRIYIMILGSRDKRQIIGYDIAFGRSQERIQRLVDSSAKASKYYSDAYSAYAEIFYDGVHASLKNKSQTYTVKGVNSDLRHYIPALHLRSKCFFRSLETMNAVFKIFTLTKFFYPSF